MVWLRMPVVPPESVSGFENSPDDLVLAKIHVIVDPPGHPGKCLKVATVEILGGTILILKPQQN